jgi:dTDP-4-dehydrorhamnose 3,5-epimerase
VIIIDTIIDDVKIIEPKIFGDARGFFLETWNAETFRKIGLDLNFVQDNHSRSSKGILRGLHYQIDRPQGKLVRVSHGSVIDIAVDLRRSSATFGQHVAIELSEENKRMLWIPPGFAHGFLVRSASADFIYKCTELYAPAQERCLLWSDPELAIDWKLDPGQRPELSGKDQNGLLLKDIETFP